MANNKVSFLHFCLGFFILVARSGLLRGIVSATVYCRGKHMDVLGHENSQTLKF